jgi:hypothetical protein
MYISYIALFPYVLQGEWPNVVEFLLRPTVSRPVRLGIGSPLEPMTRFYPYPFFSDDCFVVLPVGRPL